MDSETAIHRGYADLRACLKIPGRREAVARLRSGKAGKVKKSGSVASYMTRFLAFRNTARPNPGAAAVDRGFFRHALSLILRPDTRKYKLLDHLLEFKYLPWKALGAQSDTARAISREELRQLSPPWPNNWISPGRGWPAVGKPWRGSMAKS
uniref:Uncharacterized protein n=1 Tax=Candidatus Kentrum eta TaxID=2126337 RepID=A0A450UW51_9GAMM|nr:MAG: hypothetical protein BECKH772A_GA0070896_101099 [Candidatus Kentron sp. H]VFJ97363.1 MAG: hypothetical protein BECKH772B_GA0070898_1011011 [Candidatus Kentron sp. H]